MNEKDIVPELLEQLQESFSMKLDNDEKLKKYIFDLEDESVDYQDANEYAIRVGELLGEVFEENIDSSALPDGKMYYNIAKRILNPLLKEDYDNISSFCEKTQAILNSKADINIKAILPDLNQDRINGLIDVVSEADKFEDAANMLMESFVNFSQSIVDDSIKKNADFHYKTGFRPKIVRRSSGNCCEWCSKLVGTYDYEEVKDTGNDVFRRHQNCRCIVIYKPTKRKSQDVWNKKVIVDDSFKAFDQMASKKKIWVTKNLEDVTSEYVRKSQPGKGEIIYENGYKIQTHKDEINVAEWLHRNFGGDIVLINEKNIQNVKSADYFWNGKLWDLKTVTTEKAANSAIRKGIKQIVANPGGIILNYGNSNISTTNLIKEINHRLEYSDISIDIIVICNNRLEKVYRNKK